MQVMFIFFRPFSDQFYRLSLPHTLGPQTPASPYIIPTTMLCPLSLVSPTAAIASFTGMQVKICFFLFFFFIPFLTNVTETLYPTCQVLKPPPLHHIIPTPMLFPSSLASPAATIACICRHASKDKFFFFFFFLFFVSFLTNVTETLFTPHARSSNPCLSTT